MADLQRPTGAGAPGQRGGGGGVQLGERRAAGGGEARGRGMQGLPVEAREELALVVDDGDDGHVAAQRAEGGGEQLALDRPRAVGLVQHHRQRATA
ncbi:MAG: hypothetical protein ACK559_18575, partial [bacterium]